MDIYNPSSSSMVSSYSPPPPGSTPAIISLPAPSQTGYSGSSGESVGAPSVVYPTSTAGAGSSSSNNDTTAIALGTTFGIIGLIAGALATLWYIKRSRGRESSSNGRFFALGGDHKYDSTDDGPTTFLSMGSETESQRSYRFLGARAFPLAAALTHVGLSKHCSPPLPRPRRDMFADEDTREFGWGSPPDVLRREGSAGTSTWSMRSMGAMVRGMISREPSVGNSGRGWDDWEKIEGDHRSLMNEGNNSYNVTPSGPSHGQDGSSWSYIDPFSDPVPPDEEYDLYQPYHEALKPDGEYDNIDVDAESRDLPPLRPLRTSLPPSAPIPTLSPLREVASDSTNTLASCLSSSQTNSSSFNDHSSNNTYTSQPSFPSQPPHSPGTPSTLRSSAPTIAPLQRHSSILDSYSPSSNPVRRSNSWWGRFMKTSLLDRRNSTGQKPLDLRDPNPAPRLMSIYESNTASDSHESKCEQPVKHIRLISPSVHSGRTANTEVAERLGGSYDVVQRIASDGSTSHRTASIGSISANEHGILGGLSSDLTSSRPIYPASCPSSCSKELSRTGPTALGSRFSWAASHAVTSRVQEIERQMTNNLVAEHSRPPRNTRKREEVPSRTRPSVQYGLAPRASLYVANPDKPCA